MARPPPPYSNNARKKRFFLLMSSLKVNYQPFFWLSWSSPSSKTPLQAASRSALDTSTLYNEVVQNVIQSFNHCHCSRDFSRDSCCGYNFRTNLTCSHERSTSERPEPLKFFLLRRANVVIPGSLGCKEEGTAIAQSY